MSTVINTNLASLFAQNSLSNAQNNLAQSVQRLSSGLRINSAKDDAAGLAISQNMQGQINATNQSVRNLNNATNLLQTADSSLSTVQDMLLRMKQLSVQGFDGSLTTGQKLNIVNELKDLDAEINATASRTAFNNINLLGSANVVDRATGDLSAGTFLTQIAVADDAGGVTQEPTDLAGTTTTLASYEITLDASSDEFRNLPGTYTFNAAGDQLTLSATINGVYKSQTLTVAGVDADLSADVTESQTLRFTDFGFNIQLDTTVTLGDPSVLASDIAADLDTKTIVLEGQSAKITNINVANANSGKDTFTAATGVLTATFTDAAGDDSTESITLLDLNFEAGKKTTIDFKGMGISFDILNYQDSTGEEIADLIAAQDNAGLGGGTGELFVNQGAVDALKFQSGANSSEFIQINTIDIRTSSQGSNYSMGNLGSKLGSVSSLDSADDLDTWQTAFKAMEAAVTEALDYISDERAIYGSQMNRLSYVSTNLQAQSTNLQNSRSAIIDTDFAAETAKLTKGQIMQQAATAMLAQANQMPNVILSLLK
jgi:flagellin